MSVSNLSSVRLPPLQTTQQRGSTSSLSDDPYNRTTRRSEIRKGSRALLQMEEMADKTWRHAVPKRERDEFLAKVGPLRSLRQPKSRSNPTLSPRMTSRLGAATPMSLMSYAGVNDPEYITNIERRLIYDRQKMHFREKSSIFPTEKDYEEANRAAVHSPRAVSYVPALAKQTDNSGGVEKLLHKPPAGKQQQQHASDTTTPDVATTDRSSRQKRSYSRRGGPTQYHSNTGLVMVMKPPKHALVGTVYEHRPLAQEHLELKQFRLYPENLLREDTSAMLERCDKLLNPTATETMTTKKAGAGGGGKEPMMTPTDWNRSISRSPNLHDLRSQLPDNASPFMIQDQQLLLRRDVVEQSRRDHSQALAAAMNLQKIMRPEGRPMNRHLVDSVSKCVDWLDKNFA